jgi:hypothetical protein
MRVNGYIHFQEHFYREIRFDPFSRLFRITDNLHLSWCGKVIQAFYELFESVNWILNSSGGGWVGGRFGTLAD